MAAEHALPALTRTPAASNKANRVLLLKPGTEKLSVVGTAKLNGALNTTPGNAVDKACASCARWAINRLPD